MKSHIFLLSSKFKYVHIELEDANPTKFVQKEQINKKNLVITKLEQK